MPLRPVKDPTDDSIPVRTLREGQVAEVVAWSNDLVLAGELLRRDGGKLVNLSHSYGSFLIPAGDEYRVRVSPDGTQLEVFDNE